MTVKDFKAIYKVAENFAIEVPSYYSVEVVDAIDGKEKLLTLLQAASIVRSECWSMFGNSLSVDATYSWLKKYQLVNL